MLLDEWFEVVKFAPVGASIGGVVGSYGGWRGGIIES